MHVLSDFAEHRRFYDFIDLSIEKLQPITNISCIFISSIYTTKLVLIVFHFLSGAAIIFKQKLLKLKIKDFNYKNRKEI